MDKITYLAELAEGLARWVPERERRNILNYYAEYFEEAGPEREAEVVAELGDPWALSCRMAVEGGFVTQEGAMSWTPPKKRRWPWVLAGTLTAVVVVAVSAAYFFAQVGQFIGRTVASYTESNVADLVPGDPQFVWAYSDKGVTYTEGSSFWTMEDGTLEGFQSIDANISLGNIMVTGGEDFTLYIGQSGSLGGYTLKWEVKNGVLVIRDGSSGSGFLGSFDDLKKLFHMSDLTLDVVITVPDAALDRIDVKTDLGNVLLADVYAKQAEAKTDLGNVECYSVRVEKKLDLKTDLGNVTLSLGELWDGVDIDLDTSLGNVEAYLGCAERDCAYELKTDWGNVSVNGQSCGAKVEHRLNAPYKLNAESSKGNVDVYFDA